VTAGRLICGSTPNGLPPGGATVSRCGRVTISGTKSGLPGVGR